MRGRQRRGMSVADEVFLMPRHRYGFCQGIPSEENTKVGILWILERRFLKQFLMGS
jgi:hypothetical protein